MSKLTEDARLAVANMHALSRATLSAADAGRHRKHMAALADYAADLEPLAADDPRSGETIAAGIDDAGKARRFAARVRGVVLGCAAHKDSVQREAGALAREAVKGEGVPDAYVEQRAIAAFRKTREDLQRDVVRLGSNVHVPEGSDDAATMRRWGGVRTLELNAFVAAFTRDGTDPEAMLRTREGPDAGALRWSLAAVQAALSLAPEASVDDELLRDAHLAEVALPVLLANLVASLQGR